MVDTKERIARSNIYSIFGKLMCRVINNNGDGEVILKKAGLSAYVETYKDKLCPYGITEDIRTKIVNIILNMIVCQFARK